MYFYHFYSIALISCIFVQILDLTLPQVLSLLINQTIQKLKLKLKTCGMK